VWEKDAPLYLGLDPWLFSDVVHSSLEKPMHVNFIAAGCGKVGS
jgi:hypothetical protein